MISEGILVSFDSTVFGDDAKTATNSASDAVNMLIELIWESFHEKIFGDDDEAGILCYSHAGDSVIEPVRQSFRQKYCLIMMKSELCWKSVRLIRFVKQCHYDSIQKY